MLFSKKQITNIQLIIDRLHITSSIYMPNTLLQHLIRDKMKIFQIHNFYQHKGGEDQVFFSEAELLKNAGHKVIQYTLHNDSIENMVKLTLAQKTLWNHKSYQEIDCLIQVEKPDVCHFHNTFPLISPSAYYACQKHQIPVVQTLHNYRLMCPSAVLFRDGKVCEDCIQKFFPWPGVLHACYRGSRIQSGMVAALLSVHRLMDTWHNKVDCFIVLTEFAKKKYIEAGLPENKMMISPNFIDEDPGPKKIMGDYALFVGRLTEEKGVNTLLNAFIHLPDIPLKVVGDGPLLKKMRAQVEKSQVNNVDFLGRVSREVVMDMMKNARLLIFPSEWYEGFPMAIVEAYSCGLPIIASNLGAMEELVIEGVTGRLFETGDAKSLSDAILSKWDDEKEIEQWGSAARTIFDNKYGTTPKYESLMNIYRKAIDEKITIQ